VTGTNASGPPTGFWIAVPDGWISLDVDPGTSAESARKLAEAAVAGDPSLREQQGAIAQLLTDLTRNAADSGVRFCACFFQVFEEQLPVQASLTVAFHALDSANDPAAMLGDLQGEGRRLEMVELDAGQAVRRSGRRRESMPGSEEVVEFLSCQYYIKLPATTDRIALLTFTSPTVALEDDLLALFESVAGSFVFTWEG
jgi:hypothetical protein